MKNKNQGYDVEYQMRKWFKGYAYPSYCVDFQTKNSLCEVKSCKLLLNTTNRNDLRETKGETHKRIRSHQLGRFFLDRENHAELGRLRQIEGKEAKYIFVLRVGNQNLFRVYTWDFVEKIILEKYPKKDKKSMYLTIKEIFQL